MPTNYPGSIDTFTNPVSTDLMSSVTVPHATQHTNLNDSVFAIETKLGIDNSGITTSIDYLLKSSSSINPGHKHTTLFTSTGVSSLQFYQSLAPVFAGLPHSKTITYVGSASGLEASPLFTWDYTNKLLRVEASGSATGIKFSQGTIYDDGARLISSSLYSSSLSALAVYSASGFFTLFNAYSLFTTALVVASSIAIGSENVIVRRTAGVVAFTGTSMLEVPQSIAVGTTASTAIKVYGYHTSLPSGGTQIGIKGEYYITGPNTQFNFIQNVEGFTTHSTGNIQFLSGSHNRVRIQSTGNTSVTEAYGLYNMAWANCSSGRPSVTTLAGGRFEGQWASTNMVGTGSVTNCYAGYFLNNHATLTATAGYVGVTNNFGIRIGGTVGSGVVVASSFGLRIDNFTGTGGGIGTNHGLYIEDITRGDRNYAVFIAGTSGVNRQAIWYHVDTNLWRKTASALTTDGEFSAGRRVTSNVVSLTDSASITPNLALGNHFRVTLGGNRSMTRPVSALDGQKITFEIAQDFTGNRTMTWDQAFRFGADLPSATLSTSGYKVDIMTCIFSEPMSAYLVAGFLKGY